MGPITPQNILFVGCSADQTLGRVQLSEAGLSVPATCVIDASAGDLRENLRRCVAHIERITGRSFAAPKSPLLLAASNAKGAVTNIGLDDRVIAALAEVRPRLGVDCRRRFIAAFGRAVGGVGQSRGDPFDAIVAHEVRQQGKRSDVELGVDDLEGLIGAFVELARSEGLSVPSDPFEQLVAVVESLGTEGPVMLSRMILGNASEDSGAGIVFTRDPGTGEKGPIGDFVIDGQSSDLAHGRRELVPVMLGIDESLFTALSSSIFELERRMTGAVAVDFVVEAGELCFIDARHAHLSPRARIRTAVELVKDGIIDERGALARSRPEDFDQLIRSTVQSRGVQRLIARGLPASPGAATGKLVVSPSAAESESKRGEPVILVRSETSKEDVRSFSFARGVLTTRGGLTSHAAVVARSLGKPCVVGATELRIDEKKGVVEVAGETIDPLSSVTIDGGTGEVFLGEAAVIGAELPAGHAELLRWADEHRRLSVRANVDSAGEAALARKLGAEGIGLLRTDHFFRASEHVKLVQRSLFLHPEEADVVLEPLVDPLAAELLEVLEAAEDQPVTVRLLDAPLSDFLPETELQLEAIAEESSMDLLSARERLTSLTASTPVLGLRGARLALRFPEICSVELHAMGKASQSLIERGKQVRLEVLVPFICSAAEMEKMRAMVRRVFRELGAPAPAVGALIELPRAALVADEITAHSDFLLFGTNDLTQATLGLSREDTAALVAGYVEDGILDIDPFIALDRGGVGVLIEMAVEKARSVRRDLPIGASGEHAAEESAVAFFHRLGLDYVSCTTLRVPSARLSAALAAIKGEPS